MENEEVTKETSKNLKNRFIRSITSWRCAKSRRATKFNICIRLHPFFSQQITSQIMNVLKWNKLKLLLCRVDWSWFPPDSGTLFTPDGGRVLWNKWELIQWKIVLRKCVQLVREMACSKRIALHLITGAEKHNPSGCNSGKR